MASNELSLLPEGFQLEDHNTFDPSAMDQTKKFEGFSPNIYRDTVGKRTVGYGFNVDDPSVAAILPSDVVNGRRPINPDESDKAFSVLYTKAKDDAVKVVGIDTFDNLPPSLQHVVTDMSYNMGMNKLSGFKKAIGALKSGDYQKFGEEIKNSKWFSQVGNRSKAHLNTINSLPKKRSILSQLNPFGATEANADELSPDEAAQLPQGFQIEDSSAQVPVNSPSPAQAASGAMAVGGLPVLSQKVPDSVAMALNGYQPPPTPEGPDQSVLPEGFNLEDQMSGGKPKSFMDHVRSIFGKSDEEKQAEAANIYAISKVTGIPLSEVEKHYDTLKKDPNVTGMSREVQNPQDLIGGAASTIGKAGERYPAGVMKSIEDIQSGKKTDVLNNIFTPNPDHRDAMQIALDVGQKVLPKSEIKDPNSKLEYMTTVAKEFVKNLPFAIAGGVSEFANPVNQLVGGAITKVPNVNIPAPKWVDNTIKGVIDNFGAPFSSLNTAAKTKLTNSIVDEIYTKVEPRMDELKQNFKDIYGREATVEDIKGQIRNKIDTGIKNDNVTGLVKKLIHVKSQNPILSRVEEPKALPSATPSESAPVKAQEPIDVQGKVVEPTTKSPMIVEAEKHGTVVGIDSGTKLPIIDTSKPLVTATPPSKLPVAEPVTPFVEKRKAAVEGSPRNRLSDWTDVVDQYSTNDGKFYQISKLPISDSIKGRLIEHYKLNEPLATEEVKPIVQVKATEQTTITDQAQVQEIKNSIAEGQMILKSGKTAAGRVMSAPELEAVQTSINNAKARIGMTNAVEVPNVQIPKTEEIRQGTKGQEAIKTVGTNAGSVSNEQTITNEITTPDQANRFIGDFSLRSDVNIKNDKVQFVNPATTPKELASRIDQLNKFAQANAILRRNSTMKKAMGSFQGKGAKDATKSGLIKLDNKTLLSDSDYVTTMAHELGHAIEHAVVGKTGNAQLKVFGNNIDKSTLKTMYNELFAVTEAVAPGGLKSKPEYYAKPAELIARFLEKMITAPSDLEAMAPTVMKAFESQAEKHPIIDEFLKVAQDKLYNKKDIPKGQVLPDLRETYQKELGSKRLGNIAFGNYVSYRAMRERGKITIEKFMNEKFKGIKDKPEDLFDAAEGIKVSKSGVPEFGTRSYNVARTPEEEQSLTASGWTKMPDPVWEGEKSYPQFAKWNKPPKEAQAAFDKLSPQGKQIVLDFTAQRSEAKDYFNREMIQSANNIDRTIEGWVHHFWQGESSSTAVGGDRFRTKVAGTRKQRMGASGYVKDLNAAITKAMTDLDGEKVWNDFIGRHLAMVTRPLAEGQQPMKGWIEVQGDLKKGIGRPVERQKTIIVDTAAGKSFPLKVSRYQMPKEIYRHYELIKDLADEASLPLKIVNYLQQYWQINTLFHAGTAATNFIGGGILFSNKVLHDMYLEGLTGDFKMPQTRANIAAMFKVLMPHGWAKAPDWVYGSDLSNFYGQFMSKGIDPVGHSLDKVGDTALLAFGTIERYWKKVIMTSEGMSDVSKLGTMSKEGLRLPVKEEREMLAAINDTVDLYAFDYDNVSGALEQFRRNPVARGFKPYATYPYKYMKHIERLIRSTFDRSRSWQDRTATLMALATLMAGYAYYSNERKKLQQTPEAPVESKIPARLQTRGRTFVGTTEDGKELFSRFGKYPYFGLSETGVQLAHGNMEAGRDALNDVVGSLGPFANLTMLAFGYRNKYNQYDPVPVVVGDVVGGYLPAYRVMNDISRYFDPYQRKQQTFGQAAFGKYVPTTDADLQDALHGKIRTEDVPEEGDIKGAEGKKTTVEYKLENYKDDILLSALTGVYRSRLDPAVVEAYILREEKNKIKREKKLNKK